MSQHKYLNYDSKGRCVVISNDKPLSLYSLQKLVGGYIEFVPCGDYTACINEDGLLKKLPVNQAYPQFVGDIVLGRMHHDQKTEENVFIGAGVVRHAQVVT